MKQQEFPKLPEKKSKKLAQGDVDAQVLKDAYAIGKKLGLKNCEVIEWGLTAFIMRYSAVKK